MECTNKQYLKEMYKSMLRMAQMSIQEGEKRLQKEKNVEKIVIHYEDGTEKKIEKGFFCGLKEEDGAVVLDFTMCHIAGKEISMIVEGCLQLGLKLGMFGESEQGQEVG